MNRNLTTPHLTARAERAYASLPAKRPAAVILTAAVILITLAAAFTSCAPKNAAGNAASGQPTNANNTLSTAARTASIRIASMAPSYTAVLIDLGLAESIVACDSWSAPEGGLNADVVRFDMMNPDAERLAALEPDLILVSEMTKQGTSADPFKPLSDSGIRVEYLPTSASIDEIRADTARIAALVNREKEGKALIDSMDKAIAEIRAVGSTIPEEKRRTVIFELSPAPYLYSFGRGVYLDEMITAIGAKNALAGTEGWLSVGAETVVAADPDVILSNVNYSGDPVPEILGRPGWEGMKAVREKRVYYIDNNSSSQPCPRIVKALREMALAVYPEWYK